MAAIGDGRAVKKVSAVTLTLDRIPSSAQSLLTSAATGWARSEPRDLGSYGLGHRGHAAGDGVLGQAGHGVNIQLAHDPLPMRLNRAHPNAQSVGDLLIQQTFGNEREHFTLPIGQR